MRCWRRSCPSPCRPPRSIASAARRSRPCSSRRKNGLGYYMSPRMQQRYPSGEFSQFVGAEMIARKYGLTKDQLDAYALQSHQRARSATEAGRFAAEILPVASRRAGDEVAGDPHTVDEGIRLDASLEGIAG